MYIPSDTCIENFTEIIDDLSKNNNQPNYVCRDFNIDLIEYIQHDHTDTFGNKI